MVKIYKANKGGTLVVSLNKHMKAAGYDAGRTAEWVAIPDGFLLKLVPKEAPVGDKVEQAC